MQVTGDGIKAEHNAVARRHDCPRLDVSIGLLLTHRHAASNPCTAATRQPYPHRQRCQLPIYTVCLVSTPYALFCHI